LIGCPPPPPAVGGAPRPPGTLLLSLDKEVVGSLIVVVSVAGRFVG
jgi:hypothetical protein